MKYLYLIITLVVHFVIFGFFAGSDQLFIMAVLSSVIILIGLLLHLDSLKEKVIRDLGWGMLYGSCACLLISTSAFAYIYWAVSNSPF